MSEPKDFWSDVKNMDEAAIVRHFRNLTVTAKEKVIFDAKLVQTERQAKIYVMLLCLGSSNGKAYTDAMILSSIESSGLNKNDKEMAIAEFYRRRPYRDNSLTKSKVA